MSTPTPAVRKVVGEGPCPRCGRPLQRKLTVKGKVYEHCQKAAAGRREAGCGYRAFFGRADSNRIIAEWDLKNGENDKEGGAAGAERDDQPERGPEPAARGAERDDQPKRGPEPDVDGGGDFWADL